MPECRLRLMNGPTSKDRFDFGIGWLEVFTTLAGLVVVLGLWKESGTDWRMAWDHKTWPPPNSVTGSFLVAVGVFAEVAIGIFSARANRKQERKSNREIARLNAETERLREANNEMERMHAWRSLPDTVAFEKAMRAFENVRYMVRFMDAEDKEPTMLMWQLHWALRNAGWANLIDPPQRAWDLEPGVSIRRVVRLPDPLVGSKAQDGLASWLDSKAIAVRILA